VHHIPTGGLLRFLTEMWVMCCFQQKICHISETVQHRTGIVHYRKLHTRFRMVRKSTTWSTLNYIRRIRTLLGKCFWKMAFGICPYWPDYAGGLLSPELLCSPCIHIMTTPLKTNSLPVIIRNGREDNLLVLRYPLC